MSEEKRERWKIENNVFDRRSLLALVKVLKKGIIDHVDFPVSTGKEANVYRATTPDGAFVVVKIYKIETSSFIHRMEYIEGDPRFPLVKKKLSDVVYAFTKKEFKNLAIAEKAHVRAPLPIYQVKNVLVMSFLGRDGLSYPPLYKVGKELEEADFFSIVDDVKKLYRAGLVHGDLSEFNILLGEKPYLIDFAQGVVLEHPKAHVFLRRDLEHITQFFKKYVALDVDTDELYKEITEG